MERNFRLLWTGETVSGLGSSMAVVGVPLLAVSELHAGTFAVAALTAAAYCPWLVIGLPAGAWVDRLPLRRLMIACDLISIVLYASVPLAAWVGVLGVGQLLVLEMLAGAAGIFFGAAYQAYLPFGGPDSCWKARAGCSCGQKRRSREETLSVTVPEC